MKKDTRWGVFELHELKEIHVAPVDRVHQLLDICWCCPRQEQLVPNPILGRNKGWILYIHHKEV